MCNENDTILDSMAEEVHTFLDALDITPVRPTNEAAWRTVEEFQLRGGEGLTDDEIIDGIFQRVEALHGAH